MGTQVNEMRLWAEHEFGCAVLGDQRRTRRLVDVACSIGHNPQGVLAPSFSNYAETKAAYRLFDSDAVEFSAVGANHWSNTEQRCRQPGEYLLIEDTSELDFTSHEAAQGLGHIGDTRGRGVLLHSTLALRIEDWTVHGETEVSVQGLLGQVCWTRQDAPRKSHESRTQRMKRARESDRWGKLFEKLPPPSPKTEWTYMADREGDIYETLLRCRGKEMGFIVRACQSRALECDSRDVFEVVSVAPLLGKLQVQLRARPGQPARTARVSLRATAVTLRPPYRYGTELHSISVNVVEAREEQAPPGIEPIHWVLLSSWPVETLAQVIRVVKTYGKRWLVEEFHKALKSGAHVEEIQLATLDRIEPLVALLSIVAIRLLSAKVMSSEKKETPLGPDDADPVMLKVLEAKLGKPVKHWTHGALLIAIARMGGFISYNKTPGWKTIWRGWQFLSTLMQGYELAQGHKKCVQ